MRNKELCPNGVDSDLEVCSRDCCSTLLSRDIEEGVINQKYRKNKWLIDINIKIKKIVYVLTDFYDYIVFIQSKVNLFKVF